MDMFHAVARPFLFYYLIFAVSFAMGRVRGWWRPVLAAAIATVLHVWIWPLVR